MNAANQSSHDTAGSEQSGSILPSALLPLALYGFLALLLTWPTVSHLTSHLPGDGGDDPAIAWNLWWIKYALLNQGQSPFLSDYLFYPIGINLAFYTLTVLNGLTALPLTLNLGVVAASNLHLFFTFAIGGYGVFLLTRYVLVSTLSKSSPATSSQPGSQANLIYLSALLAGLFYSFAGSKLFYVALGQFNIASSHWIPFALLYLLKTHNQPNRLKNPLMTALFFTFQAWTEMTYASFILVFIALFWLYRGAIAVLRRRAITLPRLFVRNTAVLGLTCFLGLSPILAYMIPDMRTEGDFLVEGSGFAKAFSADLLGFVIPTLHHPLLGNLIAQTGIRNFTLGQHIYLGVVLLALLVAAAVGYRRRAGPWFWITAAAVFALLSLGPAVTVNGWVTPVTGPFILLQQLPFFKGNRYPSRYSVMLMLSLSVVAGFALVWLGQRVQRRFPTRPVASIALLLIGALFLFEHLSLPLPQSDMRVPPLYQTIVAQPDPFTVLDIPFAWRNGFRVTGAQTTQFMFGQFYQSAHQKRLVQGNTSRNPAFKFQYFTRAPIINSLLALETGKKLPPDRWESDRTIAPAVLDFFDIQTIVVRPYRYDRPDGTPVSQENVIAYIEEVLPVEKLYDEAGSRLYRVTNSGSIDAGLAINTGAPLAPLYFGEGWGLLTPDQPIAAQRRSVRLLLPLEPASRQITIRARLPDFDADTARTARLALNGWRSEAQAITQDWQALTFSLPANIAVPGLNDLWLQFDSLSTLPPAPPILDLTVLSAGEEVGDFGHIYLNGRDLSLNQRGYNVAAISPNGAPVVDNFDTHLDLAASAQLAQLLNAADWPAETLIAVAAADEASATLNEEAVAALHAIGGQGDLRGCFRCSHAIISQGGETPFTNEALDPLQPVGVTTQLGLTEPTVAALIEAISVEAAAE